MRAVATGRTEHLSRLAYDLIRRAITEGQLPPTVVIREVDLVRQYGMSRTPIREALHRLHAEGLIQPCAVGGYVALELGPKALEDIYGVREVLVGLAASLSAQHRSRVDLARLEDTLDALDGAFKRNDGERADELIRIFHRALAEASGNDYLNAMLVRVTDLFRYQALAVSHPEWQAALRLQHRALVEAIARQDAVLSERLGRELISTSLSIRIGDNHTSSPEP